MKHLRDERTVKGIFSAFQFSECKKSAWKQDNISLMAVSLIMIIEAAGVGFEGFW